MGKKKHTPNSNNSSIKTSPDDEMPQRTAKKNGSHSSGTKSPRSKSSTKQSSGGSTSYLILIGASVLIAVTAIILVNDDIRMFLVKLTPAGSNPFGVSPPQSSERTSETTDNEQQSMQGSDLNTQNVDSNTKADGNDTKTKRESYVKSAITSKGDFKIRKKLDAADKLLEEGSLDKALTKYDSILVDHASSPRALFGKGRTLDKMSEKQRSNKLLEEAISTMDKALRAPKTPRQLVMEIAELLAKRQSFRGWSWKEAETWQYVEQLFPDNLEAQRQQGVAYLKLGKNDKAKVIFRKILDTAPDDGFSLVHLGFIYKIHDLDNEESIKLLQRGLDMNEESSRHGRFYYHLGDAYVRTHQPEKARQVYQRGAELGLFLSADQRSLYNADTKLTGRPWWTPEQTTYTRYLKLLEENWKTIRDEGMAQLNKKTGAFEAEAENLRETGDWKQFTLYSKGQKDKNNCKKAPKTCALIDQIPEAAGCKRGQVKFSVMHGGVHVWAHTGPTNCRLRAHLGLKVPDGPRIRVGNETGTWKEGKFIIFDDSFEHEVWHDGTELRMVLIVDFWHPEIPDHERNSLSPI